MDRPPQVPHRDRAIRLSRVHPPAIFVYGCSAPKVLACMYDETERQKIDSTLVRFCRVASIDADTDVVYHHSRFPLEVLQQRDAVVWRHRLEHNTEQHQYTVMWVSCTTDHPPAPTSCASRAAAATASCRAAMTSTSTAWCTPT